MVKKKGKKKGAEAQPAPQVPSSVEADDVHQASPSNPPGFLPLGAGGPAPPVFLHEKEVPRDRGDGPDRHAGGHEKGGRRPREPREPRVDVGAVPAQPKDLPSPPPGITARPGPQRPPQQPLPAAIAPGLPSPSLPSLAGPMLPGPPPGRPMMSNPTPAELLSHPSPTRGTVHKPQVPAGLPADTAGVVSVRKGLGDMSLQADKSPTQNRQIPPRKNLLKGGTLGRPMLIETNHLALDLSKMTKQVVHYDVDLQPDRPKRLIRPVMQEFRRQFYPKRNPAFDGRKNLYSSSLLPFGIGKSADITITDPERERTKEFKVTVKQVGMINMESLIKGAMSQVPQTAISALDIILRSAPANRMVQVGRSFFTPPQGRVHDLGDGMESWLGFFQSAIIGWKPFVNIDVAHKGFPKVQSCEKVVQDLFGPRNYDNIQAKGMDNWQKLDFTKYIRELKVEYLIPGQPNTKRTYRVNGIAKSAKEQGFQLDDGRNITVQQYYAMNKKYIVKFPNLPCLDVGSPNREKKILVPCELCTVIGGQVVIKKMTENQTSALIKIAATSTDDRRRKIVEAMQRVDFKNDPSVQEFGVRVNDKFEQVKARVLDPPQLQYKDKTPPVRPMRGVWRNNDFLEGKTLTKWTILSMDRYVRADNLRSFVDQLIHQGKAMGMVIHPPQQPIDTNIAPNEPVKLQNFLEHIRDFQLVFVVVQDQGNSYAKIKQMSELTVGVLTQCLKSRTLQRMNPATCGNILLKVNAKLNGCNHTFSAISKPNCLKTPCMIVGADVTHPSPDQSDMPSVAAVCASHEPKAFKYNLQYRLQPARMEIIEDLENIMVTQLKYFYNFNGGRTPQRIIFYRDGVSEGQFQEVLNKEFQAIRRACKAMAADYEPKITLLVVQKRHHTRFFPTSSNPMDCDGKNKNVPAGTIVDTIITHPTDLDFYLVSHASIQGVSRPTKYRRLWDDSDFSEDELEVLTYYLCHMFTRCTRSVSYPAPTYYAHLAAYRARCYIDQDHRIKMTNLANEQKLRTIKQNIISESPMFFV